MQKPIKIAINDSKYIYGYLNQSSEKESKVVVFVHGFTGDANEHQYFNAAPFFNSKGFATLRFNFYGREPDARKTSKVSFLDHLNDTRAVIDYLSREFNEIYLVGHSLGACVVSLVDKTDVKRIVIWDPANGFGSPQEKGMVFNSDLNVYICDYKMEILFGKELIEEWAKVTIEKQIESFKVPTKIIFAGNHNKYDQWKAYLLSIKVVNEHFVVPGASHEFVEEGTSGVLFEETYKWFNL